MSGKALTFAFHQSYRKAFNKLDDGQTVRLLEAMMAYAFDEEDTDFSDDDLLDMAWIGIKPNIASSVSHSKRARKSESKSTGKTSEKTSGKTTSETTGESTPHRTERSGVEDDSLPIGREENHPTAASGGAAAAKAAPPPLPDGWERTGVKCSHSGCDALQLRESDTGTLWCPECDSSTLSMMGVRP